MKKILVGFLLIITVCVVSGCEKKENKEEKSETFTITCEINNPKEGGMTVSNTSKYVFNKDQYATSYELATIIVFDEEEVYKIYKESNEEMARTNTNEKLEFNISGDDETRTLTSGYKVSISSEELEQDPDKDFYKAKNVLERLEENKAKCNIEGIDRSNLN